MTKEHVMKEHLDAYRYYFPFASIELFNLDSMVEKTGELPRRFERFEPYDEKELNGESEIHGLISDIKDFSKIVVFGKTGGGEPFCLDYRGSLQEPKVIFWSNGLVEGQVNRLRAPNKTGC